MINPNLYKVSPSSPLYGHYLSFSSYNFSTNRPFAAWNHWAYEWNLIDDVLSAASDVDPVLRQVEIRYRLGMMSQEEYNQIMEEYQKQLMEAAAAAANASNSPLSSSNTTN